MNFNLYSIFKAQFSKHLSKNFIETTAGATFSYADLDKETAKIANFFSAMGLQRGDRVAVQLEKSPYALFLYLACLRSGIIYLPLNPAYKEDELAYFFHDAQPSLILCKPESFAQIATLTKSTAQQVETLGQNQTGTLFSKINAQNCLHSVVITKKEDIAVILYTSGTTAKPKGAMLSHYNLYSNGKALAEYWAFKQQDVLLHALPLFHVHGLFFACHCVLFSGASMYFLEKFETKDVIAYLAKSTVMMGVPTYYARLLSDPGFNDACCKTIRLFISGSAPLNTAIFEEFKTRTKQALLERYGMTEAGIISSNPLSEERIAGTVGFPLPGTCIRIINDQAEKLAQDKIGHIQIKGDSIFLGYWNMPEITAQAFTEDGYFKTGDMGKFNAKGYLEIVGRAKDLIITGGLNVYPKEVEICIDEIKGVQESAVIGIEHPDYGEAVTAIIVKQKSSLALTDEIIIERLKKKLAGYKVPKRLFFLSELPRNTMGKVEKHALRIQYKDSYKA